MKTVSTVVYDPLSLFTQDGKIRDIVSNKSRASQTMV